MNILFDLYTTQGFIGGAAEYIRRVFFTLIDEINKKQLDIHIIALVDISFGKFVYKDLSPESLLGINVTVADIKKSTLKEIISKYKINKCFIGAGQYFGKFDLENINVPTICVIHDLCSEEYNTNNLYEYALLNDFKYYLRYKFHVFRKGNPQLDCIPKIMAQAKRNIDFKIVTVSEYSKSSIAFYFDYPQEKIDVLYSPERVNLLNNSIESTELNKLLDSKKYYYLMLSANRVMKNPEKVFHAFERFQRCSDKEVFLVTTGCKEKKFDHHIPMPYLSDCDLSQLISHCYALLFPSFFEGFGYPPIEAMKFGKPVLASNTTSIPEICGNAPLYFSPFYESDIFRCLNLLNDKNYSDYESRSITQYMKISKRQEVDLVKLIDMISKF